MAYDLGNLTNVTNYLSQQQQNGSYIPTNGSQGMPSQGWDLWAGYNPQNTYQTMGGGGIQNPNSVLSGGTYNPVTGNSTGPLSNIGSSPQGPRQVNTNIGMPNVQQQTPSQQIGLHGNRQLSGQVIKPTFTPQTRVVPGAGTRSAGSIAAGNQMRLDEITRNLQSQQNVGNYGALQRAPIGADAPAVGSTAWNNDQYLRSNDYLRQQAQQSGLGWDGFVQTGGYQPGMNGYLGSDATPVYNNGMFTDPNRGSWGQPQTTNDVFGGLAAQLRGY